MIIKFRESILYLLSRTSHLKVILESTEIFPIKIWIDADACPAAIKEILFRTAKRMRIVVTLVANQSIHIPKSEFVRIITVPYGANIADQKIVELMSEGDIVITGDIPLASDVVEKGGTAIGTRGELFDERNIGSRLASRNLMEQMRSAGVETSGPRPLGSKDVQAFANRLDQLLTKRRKELERQKKID